MRVLAYIALNEGEEIAVEPARAACVVGCEHGVRIAASYIRSARFAWLTVPASMEMFL